MKTEQVPFYEGAFTSLGREAVIGPAFMPGWATGGYRCVGDVGWGGRPFTSVLAVGGLSPSCGATPYTWQHRRAGQAGLYCGRPVLYNMTT